jgi:hypothetical protein
MLGATNNEEKISHMKAGRGLVEMRRYNVWRERGTRMSWAVLVLLFRKLRREVRVCGIV